MLPLRNQAKQQPKAQPGPLYEKLRPNAANNPYYKENRQQNRQHETFSFAIFHGHNLRELAPSNNAPIQTQQVEEGRTVNKGSPFERRLVDCGLPLGQKFLEVSPSDCQGGLTLGGHITAPCSTEAARLRD